MITLFIIVASFITFCIHRQQPTTTCGPASAFGLSLPSTTMRGGIQLSQSVQRLFSLVKTAYKQIHCLIAHQYRRACYGYDTLRRLCTYANGNISEYIDLSDGSITSHHEYDAFGNVTTSTGTAPCSFGFSTKYQDQETDLLYYGYRYLNPETGRWINRDPIEESGGVNLYAFVNNDGINLWDYIGLLVSVSYVKDAEDNSQGCIVVTDDDSSKTHKFYAKSSPPLSDGTYAILERAGKKSYYRLEANDGRFGDDKAEFASVARTQLRFHKGSGTIGCIACKPDKKNQADWGKAEQIILGTTTGTKSVRRGGIGGMFGLKEELTFYGTLTVSTEKAKKSK